MVYNAIGPEWRRNGNPRRKRPLESVVLADGVADNIHNDVKEFIESEKWFVYISDFVIIIFNCILGTCSVEYLIDVVICYMDCQEQERRPLSLHWPDILVIVFACYH